MWAQGYSEPEAGSDLAALKMTARRDGDDYVLDGQKTWTSNGRAGRLDLRAGAYRSPLGESAKPGISFFLVDLRHAWHHRRPIRSMTGYPTFAEEFFDDVRVPAANLVGDENEGWNVAKALLVVERSNITRAAQAQRYLDELIEWCQEQTRHLDDPLPIRPTASHWPASWNASKSVARCVTGSPTPSRQPISSIRRWRHCPSSTTPN